MSTEMEAFKKKVLDAQRAGDIAALYVMEREAHEILKDEEDMGAFYANILELALENLTTALETGKRFKLDEVQDYATIRALYEYAIEHYSAESVSDAAALFEIIEGLTQDGAFINAMKIHRLSASEGLGFDEFLERIADVEATQNAGTFYISHFSEAAQHLLNIAEVSEGTL